MYVIKASGQKEEFSKEKIRKTCLKAGASRELAEEVARQVYKRVYNGIPTKKILEIALKLLKKDPVAAIRYDIKRAIMSLGPKGFYFEKFFAAILKNYEYTVDINRKIRGLCVLHEIDIVANKDLRYMVECKYHNLAGIPTDLKVALYTYARFLDLKSFFDRAWLVTNTKVSNDAIQYAKCKSIKITSWHYPHNENLQVLMDQKKLYPVTLLKSVNGFTMGRLVDSGFILTKDLLDYDFKELKQKLNLSDRLLSEIVKEVEGLNYKSQ